MREEEGGPYLHVTVHACCGNLSLWTWAQNGGITHAHPGGTHERARRPASWLQLQPTIVARPSPATTDIATISSYFATTLPRAFQCSSTARS